MRLQTRRKSRVRISGYLPDGAGAAIRRRRAMANSGCLSNSSRPNRSRNGNISGISGASARAASASARIRGTSGTRAYQPQLCLPEWA